jgi:hypothetical protein
MLPHSKATILTAAAAVKEAVTSIPDEAVDCQEEKGVQEERGEPDKDAYLVVWESKDDPMNPKNFPMPAKILIGIQV